MGTKLVGIIEAKAEHKDIPSVIDYQDVLNFRGARMNYFCVLGLMARLEMLRQNPEDAYVYATQVLKECEGIISLVDKANSLILKSL